MRSAIRSAIRNEVKKKLKSRAGESIAETLVSLLISSLALVMLAGTLTASSGMIMKGRAKLGEYYAANEDDSGVVKMNGEGKEITEGVTIKEDAATGTFSQSCDVTYYKNDKFENKVVVAYKMDGTSGSN